MNLPSIFSGPRSRARPNRLLFRAWLVSAAALICALGASAVAARDVSSYVRVAASPDGIGFQYMGREIARVMGYEGADWLERDTRTAEERPDLLLRALELKPGMTVADIGAGTGYYSWRMAERVGKSGRVLAIDVQPQMIALLDREMKRRGVVNVKSTLGTATDPKLPEGTVDLALMVDVYHELEHPYEILSAIVRSLKPGGRVVFVEYRGEDPAVPIKPHHKMTEAQVKKEAAALPLEWVKTVEDLPWQHVIVFRKKP